MREFDNLATSRLKQVLRRLDKESNHERLVEKTIPHDYRMNAITLDTGLFFNSVLKAIHARNVLEVGTSAGYSTLWLVDAIIKNTNRKEKKGVITIEKNFTKVERARKNFIEAGVADFIEIREGEAKKILHDICKEYGKEFFDFAFIDADKEGYIDYFNSILPLVKAGGIIVADNILLPKHFQPYMVKYVKAVKNKPNVQSVTIKIGKGEEFTLKTA
jgi:caffeoyl-CoA O-methyltransferase